MKKTNLIATGDIILGSDPTYFEGVKDMLVDADIVLGQLEVPYSDRAPELADLERSPDNLKPLKEYFDAVSLAGNHIYDAKEIGVEDTVKWLRENKLPYFGGGMDINEARKPVILQQDGLRIGLLSYNCVGPASMNASEDKAGCAYVNINTHYDMGNIANPGGDPQIIKTWPEEESFLQMQKDIEALRDDCDILCVYLHKGLVHKPVKLAEYEATVSYKAIDCGADVIFSSHSHILHGVEVYKGKTIYHGLNNFIAWVPSLNAAFRAKKGVKNEIFDPEKWAKKRSEMFKFTPDPEYPTYPFHPESIYTVTAKCVIKDKKIVETRLIPMVVEKSGIPYVVGKENGGEAVFQYMKDITEGAGLNAKFVWDGDEIVIE